jgi:hypothetical protein
MLLWSITKNIHIINMAPNKWQSLQDFIHWNSVGASFKPKGNSFQWKACFFHHHLLPKMLPSLYLHISMATCGI